MAKIYLSLVSFKNNWLTVIAIILFLIFFYTSPLWATNEGAGDAWSFLNIGMGARAMGLGGAFVAIADDATATYWNPAGLGMLRKREFILANASTKGQIFPSNRLLGNHHYLSGVWPISKDGSVGVALNSLSIGDIQQTTGTSEFNFERGDLFKDTEYAFTFSYGASLEKQIKRSLFVGASIRYMRQHFLDVSTTLTSGWGSDAGFILKFKDVLRQKNNIKLGWVLNANLPRKWKSKNNSEKSSDPATIGWKWGVAVETQELRAQSHLSLITALSIIHQQRSPPTLALGAELKANPFLTFRMGIEDIWFIRRNASEYIWDARKYRFVFGFGIMYSHAQFDYAATFERLGIKHRISIIIRY